MLAFGDGPADQADVAAAGEESEAGEDVAEDHAPLGQRLPLLAALADLLAGPCGRGRCRPGGRRRRRPGRGSRGRWSCCPAGARRSRSRTAAGRGGCWPYWAPPHCSCPGWPGCARLPWLARLRPTGPAAATAPGRTRVAAAARRRAAGRCRPLVRRAGAGRVRVLRVVAWWLGHATAVLMLNGDGIAPLIGCWLHPAWGGSMITDPRRRVRRPGRATTLVSRHLRSAPPASVRALRRRAGGWRTRRAACHAPFVRLVVRCQAGRLRQGLACGSAAVNLFTGNAWTARVGSRRMPGRILTAPPVTREYATP